MCEKKRPSSGVACITALYSSPKKTKNRVRRIRSLVRFKLYFPFPRIKHTSRFYSLLLIYLCLCVSRFFLALLRLHSLCSTAFSPTADIVN
ncbi:hypothetical protein SNEBB_001314 [Seison nebaliae]|nr:hypothetical protein SNEBB_001314 [Seison nebaliae]